MKIHVVVLKTDKKGVASWESFLEEVNETEKQFRIVAPLPAKPEGKKLYMKTDEYVLRKKSAGVYITYGRDAAKLAETCFAPVFALVRKNDDSYEAEAVEKAEQTLIRKICMDILTDDYQMPPEKVTKELLNQCVREVNNGPDIIDRGKPATCDRQHHVQASGRIPGDRQRPCIYRWRMPWKPWTRRLGSYPQVRKLCGRTPHWRSGHDQQSHGTDRRHCGPEIHPWRTP